MAQRSAWEGHIRLNLLSIPVKGFTSAVTGRGRVSFHQIHKGCGSRIRHQKVCPIHGKVTKDDVEPGYEYAKNRYVIVEPDELSNLRPEDEKVINIEVFVAADSVAPMYDSGRHYYLTPDGKVGGKPYVVLERVMSQQNRHAIARVVLSGREQLGLLRAIDGLLVMTILNYDQQVKPISSFKDEIPKVEVSAKELQLAKTLVEASTEEHLDMSRYHDEYEKEVLELIEAKAKGEKITERRGTSEAPAVINLMDALRKSIAQKGNKKSLASKTNGRKKRSA